MTSLNVAAIWILRITFIVSLVLGLMLWSGRGYEYLRLHMWLGFLITFALLLLVILALLGRVMPAMPIVAFVWAVLVPVIGIAQLRIMPGPNHWIIRVVHLLLGVGAIGLGEVLNKRIKQLRTAA